MRGGAWTSGFEGRISVLISIPSMSAIGAGGRTEEGRVLVGDNQVWGQLNA